MPGTKKAHEKLNWYTDHVEVKYPTESSIEETPPSFSAEHISHEKSKKDEIYERLKAMGYPFIETVMKKTKESEPLLEEYPWYVTSAPQNCKNDMIHNKDVFLAPGKELSTLYGDAGFIKKKAQQSFPFKMNRNRIYCDEIIQDIHPKKVENFEVPETLTELDYDMKHVSATCIGPQSMLKEYGYARDKDNVKRRTYEGEKIQTQNTTRIGILRRDSSETIVHGKPKGQNYSEYNTTQRNQADRQGSITRKGSSSYPNKSLDLTDLPAPGIGDMRPMQSFAEAANNAKDNGWAQNRDGTFSKKFENKTSGSKSFFPLGSRANLGSRKF